MWNCFLRVYHYSSQWKCYERVNRNIFLDRSWPRRFEQLCAEWHARHILENGLATAANKFDGDSPSLRFELPVPAGRRRSFASPDSSSITSLPGEKKRRAESGKRPCRDKQHDLIALKRRKRRSAKWASARLFTSFGKRRGGTRGQAGRRPKREFEIFTPYARAQASKHAALWDKNVYSRETLPRHQ